MVKNGTMESIFTALIVACSGFFPVFAGGNVRLQYSSVQQVFLTSFTS